jgi:hypothetical protein
MGREQIYFAEQTYLADGVVGPTAEFDFAVEVFDTSAQN